MSEQNQVLLLPQKQGRNGCGVDNLYIGESTCSAAEKEPDRVRIKESQRSNTVSSFPHILKKKFSIFSPIKKIMWLGK
jgi:hypothetical protein